MPAKAPQSTEAWFELPDGRIHEIRGECTIGRLTDNHLVLHDTVVSRHHARVTRARPGGYLLSDLGSANGTFLNRSRLIVAKPAPLGDRDAVTIGTVGIRFRLAEEAANFATERSAEAANRKKILVVGETSLGGDGLRRVIDALAQFVVAGHAPDAMRARRLHAELHPDLVLFDGSTSATGTFSLVRDLIATDAETRILVLLESADPDYISRLMRAGVLACVLRTDPAEELSRALTSAVAGSVYLSRRVAAVAMRQLAGSDEAGRRGGPMGLTDRELEIFHLIGAGRPNRDIATALVMSVKTVETHKENMKVKLGLTSAADLAARARAWIAGQAPPK